MFSRKTKTQAKNHKEEEPFSPPHKDDSFEESTSDSKLFIPKLPVKFDKEGLFNLYEISP